MPKHKPPQEDRELRRKAEEQIRETFGRPPPESADEQLRLLHELQVHQLELEMQNTELRQTKDALETLLDQYRDLYDFSPVGYLTLDRSGNIRNANLTSGRQFGLERSELISRDLIDFVTQENRSDCSAFLQIAFSRPGKQAIELMLRQKNNAPFFAQIEALAAASAEECRLAIIDVNERKRAEELFLRNSKLESLGLLAGGIAHDFNNILAAIIGNLSLARAQMSNPQKLAKRLTDAEAAATRAKDLSMQLLTFARGGAPIKKVIYLKYLIREAAQFAIHGTTVSCEFFLADDLWPVMADSGQISQVLHNLALNAVQATPEGGKLTIRAQNVAPPPGGTRWVEVALADTGTGIPADLLPKIFDPYYSTKPQGSGLGLATCHAILQKHGGNISVESTLGQGSVFRIRLPTAEEDAIPDAFLDSKVHHGQGQILVMDDEAAVRDIAQASLEELGYSVECAADGGMASELYRRRMAEGNPFAAVILDLTVPSGIGGKEALAHLREIDPQVKAIVSSGYASDPVIANYREYGFSAVLSKPYQLEELSKVLHDLLLG
ncbi:MAG: response regulator [Desulfuromonadaceae bacterium]|nr:response regulator [Desulfuromonadaceae bacterium]